MYAVAFIISFYLPQRVPVKIKKASTTRIISRLQSKIKKLKHLSWQRLNWQRLNLLLQRMLKFPLPCLKSLNRLTSLMQNQNFLLHRRPNLKTQIIESDQIIKILQWLLTQRRPTSFLQLLLFESNLAQNKFK